MAPQRFLILADGDFQPMTSKTANSAIRYLPGRVVGVVDHVAAGKTARDVLGFGDGIPIVRDMDAGLALKPDAVLIGIAPMGGKLPEAWHAGIKKALETGCDIWSGLHTFLGDDPVLAETAKKHGRESRDVRTRPGHPSGAAGMGR